MTSWMRKKWMAKLVARRQAKACTKKQLFDDMFPLCFVIEWTSRNQDSD